MLGQGEGGGCHEGEVHAGVVGEEQGERVHGPAATIGNRDERRYQQTNQYT